MDAAVSEATQVLARKGVDAVKRMYPVTTMTRGWSRSMVRASACGFLTNSVFPWCTPHWISGRLGMMRPSRS
ncbi:hypothetical protein [Pseudorhodobacter sp. E13]|uniref:hypothetical protein n=1 Tax=Pseudorhodobacter sp. E13 TaxID=2487931 RepID=UPI003511AE88